MKKSEGVDCEDVKAARQAIGLTQSEAARLVHTSVNNWRNWEQGRYTMAQALYELFMLKTRQIELPAADARYSKIRPDCRPIERPRVLAKTPDAIVDVAIPIGSGNLLNIKLDETMGSRIRILREARGLTQSDLAIAAGVTKAAVSNWETGYSASIRLHAYLRLIDVLGISDPDYLISGARKTQRILNAKAAKARASNRHKR